MAVDASQEAAAAFDAVRLEVAQDVLEAEVGPGQNSPDQEGWS